MSVRRGASGEGESLACASLAKMKLSIGLRGFHFGLATPGTVGRVIGFNDQWVSSAGAAEAKTQTKREIPNISQTPNSKKLAALRRADSLDPMELGAFPPPLIR